MGGFFSKPKAPAPPPRVREDQADETARLRAEKAEKNRQIQARLRARRGGGMRLLLSQERENSSLGLGGHTTLGSS